MFFLLFGLEVSNSFNDGDVKNLDIKFVFCLSNSSPNSANVFR
jgi:hypothetical protein